MSFSNHSLLGPRAVQGGRKEVHWNLQGTLQTYYGFPLSQNKRPYHFSRSGSFPRKEIYFFKLTPSSTQDCMLFVLDTGIWSVNSTSKELPIQEL